MGSESTAQAYMAERVIYVASRVKTLCGCRLYRADMAEVSMDEARTGEWVVELESMTFAWPGQPAILSIDELALRPGERVLVSGASGSGKSTLLGLIGGVLEPRSGSVRILGRNLSQLEPAARDRFRGDHIGFVFQMFNLIPYLSVRANVLLPLQFSRSRRQRVTSPPDREAAHLLSALGLKGDDLLNRSVKNLSVGQQQRVAAARALIGRPELLIADEPTSALDADARDDFLRLLMGECARYGTTVLLVSHDRALAPLFDRAVELNTINRLPALAA